MCKTKMVAHVILVSAQVLLVLTLRLWTLDLGLTIIRKLSSPIRGEYSCQDQSYKHHLLKTEPAL